MQECGRGAAQSWGRSGVTMVLVTGTLSCREAGTAGMQLAQHPPSSQYSRALPAC